VTGGIQVSLRNLAIIFVGILAIHTLLGGMWTEIAAEPGYDGSRVDLSIDFLVGVGSGIDTGQLPLPGRATITQAAATVTPLPSSPGGDLFPFRPWLDIGSDGTVEWKYEGTGYGNAGLQTTFEDGTSNAELDPDTGRKETAFRLPGNATVHYTKVAVEPAGDVAWWDQAWARRIPFHVEADDDLGEVVVERTFQLGKVSGNVEDQVRLTVSDPETGLETEVSCQVAGIREALEISTITIRFVMEPVIKDSKRTYYLYYDNPDAKGQKEIPDLGSPLVTRFKSDFAGMSLEAGYDNYHVYRPMGLAVAEDGRIFISDTGNHRILILDQAGRFKADFGSKGSGVGEFWCPHDLAFDDSGRLLVADTCNHRIQVFDAKLRYYRTLGISGESGLDDQHLFYPWDVDVDSKGSIFVSDTGNDRIQVYNSLDQNTASKTLGITREGGSDNQHLAGPKGISTGSEIYVADMFNNRIQSYSDINDNNADGTILSGELKWPSDVLEDDDGNLYILDTYHDRILVKSNIVPSMEIITGFIRPHSMDIDGNGNLLVADTANNRVVRIVDADLEIGQVEYNPYPTDIILDLNGEVIWRHDGILTERTVIEGWELKVEKFTHLGDCRPDRYGNPMCRVPLNIEYSGRSGLLVGNLMIRYSYQVEIPDIEETLNRHAACIGDKCHVPVSAGSDEPGRLTMNLSILGMDPAPVRLVRSISSLVVPEESLTTDLLDLDTLFQDDGYLEHTIEVVSPVPGVRVYADHAGRLAVDARAAINTTGRLMLNATATDINGQVSEPVVITIEILEVNDPPLIISEPVTEARTGQRYYYNPEIEDSDSVDFITVLLEGPGGIEIMSDGALTWIPGPDQKGKQKICFEVSDGMGSAVQEFTVAVGHDNRAPRFLTIPEETGKVGEMISFMIRAIDPDDEEIQYGLVAGPEKLEMDARTGQVKWIPSAGEGGRHTVIFQVSDGELRIVAITTITVDDPTPVCHVTVPRSQTSSGKVMVAGGCTTEYIIDSVEIKLDDGAWIPAEGTNTWHLQLKNVKPGLHTVSMKARSGVYTTVVEKRFVAEEKKSSGGWFPDFSWPSFPFISSLLIILVIGGIAVMKRRNGVVYMLHRRVDGPTMCIPVGGSDGNAIPAPPGPSVPEDETEVEEPPSLPRCFVCLGNIKELPDEVKCPDCGRAFHRSCARRVRRCPLCGEEIMEEE
jgi:sugar lactone lactonase YvrE